MQFSIALHAGRLTSPSHLLPQVLFTTAPDQQLLALLDAPRDVAMPTLFAVRRPRAPPSTSSSRDAGEVLGQGLDVLLCTVSAAAAAMPCGMEGPGFGTVPMLPGALLCHHLKRHGFAEHQPMKGVCRPGSACDC